jgi:hypothetical protein
MLLLSRASKLGLHEVTIAHFVDISTKLTQHLPHGL